ncbi:MAG: hypothetical protein IT443_03865 [Phycisphaeraceae bacterium]|nr:hypothetical protein [Phycisphaeraceae bacterium]
MPAQPFTYPVAAGWIRSLASEPAPYEPWPVVRWDEKLLEDQIRFLDAQAELGVIYNRVFGLFVGRDWPAPFDPKTVIDAQREELLLRFMDAAHQRGIKILAGTGIYSWGFETIIRNCPEVRSAGSNKQAMCFYQPGSWDWQRRILDYVMDPKWGADGISMQSADQGRCGCDRCQNTPRPVYHAQLLIRCAQYIRQQRPDWVIGQASWGLNMDDPNDLPHFQRIAEAVDYMIEVPDRSARTEPPTRKKLISSLNCAVGSVGGVFVSPAQHWDRLRYFLPHGLRTAQALKDLYDDGGRASEYHYRLFANPGDEVSWRTGAKILSQPDTSPEAALRLALAKVYSVTGSTLAQLADWYTRSEDAYFTRAAFSVGDGELNLEPLVWQDNPSMPGPPIYLRDRLTPEARADYAKELGKLKKEFTDLAIPDPELRRRTLAGVDGTLADIAALA